MALSSEEEKDKTGGRPSPCGSQGWVWAWLLQSSEGCPCGPGSQLPTDGWGRARFPFAARVSGKRFINSEGSRARLFLRVGPTDAAWHPFGGSQGHTLNHFETQTEKQFPFPVLLILQKRKLPCNAGLSTSHLGYLLISPFNKKEGGAWTKVSSRVWSQDFGFFKRFYLLIFRERWREGEWGKHQCVGALNTPPTGDPAPNPGMCPDWELNWQPFGFQACA